MPNAWNFSSESGSGMNPIRLRIQMKRKSDAQYGKYRWTPLAGALVYAAGYSAELATGLTMYFGGEPRG